MKLPDGWVFLLKHEDGTELNEIGLTVEEKNLVLCKNCKFFEYDSVEKINGVPLIVAHEICRRWGRGCKASENGWCYLAEKREEDDLLDESNAGQIRTTNGHS